VAVLALVSLLGVVWAVQLMCRARDWPMRLLTALLGLMPIYQTVSAAIETGVVAFPQAARWRMVSDLVINVLFLLSVFLLEFAVEDAHKAKVQLRVMESVLPSPAHVPLNLPAHRLEPLASAHPPRPSDDPV
jgi:hypothetical protein